MPLETDGSLRLVSLRRQQIQKLQGIFKDIAPGVSLAEELIRERREEARRESDESKSYCRETNRFSKATRSYTMISFADLLPEIRKRPTLYLSRYSIFDFQSFYYGYDLARNQLGANKTEGDKEFDDFLISVRERYNIETTQSWASLILFHSADERDALDRLFDLWEKYRASHQAGADSEERHHQPATR